MKYGYARVSPGGKGESVDAQARQLTKAGCRNVFRDVHVSGAKMGRKPKLTPHQQHEARRRRESGEPIRDIARSYNVHNSTTSRLSATATT